jgi:hypothetical protein
LCAVGGHFFQNTRGEVLIFDSLRRKLKMVSYCP